MFFLAILAKKFHNSPYFTNLFYYQYMSSSEPVFPRFRKNVSQSIVLKKCLICYKRYFNVLPPILFYLTSVSSFIFLFCLSGIRFLFQVIFLVHLMTCSVKIVKTFLINPFIEFSNL